MVVVPKKDDVRICVDLTKLNESVRRERHEMPSVEYTLGQLSDARIFSKLDANSGFWQVPLADESALLTTFITPFGRFCFKRLPFGISSAPEHFQRRMSAILEGIDGVLCQMDDILIFGATQSQHDERIREVLRRLQKGNVTLNSKKCQFSVQEVKFLGQTINESGISPDQDKVKAIIDMPEPTDVSGIRRFLGMINQLGKFTPPLAEITKPMRDLLCKKNDWMWGHAQQMCFVQLKESLTSAPVLALYNANRETTLSADASSYGLGAVLLQKQPDGELRPVAYASRAMSGVEQRYAQIEKEALATTWACERFSDFLIGKTFHIETDHKPLVSLLGQKTLDELPPRIQRFRMRLMRFRYSISHVPGKDLITADTLSRTPVVESQEPHDKSFQDECQAYVNAVMNALPVTDKRLLEIKQAQADDTTCQNIQEFCMHGWPDKAKLGSEEKLYLQVAADLTIQQGLLLKGSCLVIPEAMQKTILRKIHEGHQGITKCRERAKQSVWWPGLSKQIEDLVEKCDKCSKERQNRVEPMIPSDVPERPWQTVGSDLFELNGSNYLLVVDYLSAFVEIAKVNNTSSASIVNNLKSMFARHGIPEIVVTDNGPQYSSQTFSAFADAHGFTHRTSSPRYPQSNGVSERAVKTIKGLLKKSEDQYETLLAYRSTPLSNGYSPAELLMGRKLRTTVPVVPSSLDPQWSYFQDARKAQRDNKQRQKKAFDKRHRVVDLRPLKPGEHVWIKDMNRRGTVKTRMPAPPRSYVVKTQHGDVRRNRRHLNPTPVAPTYDADVDIPIELDDRVDAPMVVVDAPMAVVVPPVRRNPVRARNQPAYLSDYV